MERSELFDLMGELQLYGMKAAFDEVMTTAVKRQHEPQRIIGDLSRKNCASCTTWFMDGFSNEGCHGRVRLTANAMTDRRAP